MANHTVTVGLGYKYKGFYVDMAYLYRQNKSDFYTLNYDAIGEDPQYFKPVKVKDDYNRVLLTLGYKF
jgi:opacity protein-like surface antigen